MTDVGTVTALQLAERVGCRAGEERGEGVALWAFGLSFQVARAFAAGLVREDFDGDQPTKGSRGHLKAQA